MFPRDGENQFEFIIKMKWLSSVTLLCCFIVTLGVDLLVNLPYGTIRGRKLTTLGNTVFRSFQSVPYAAAPVGKLRFQAPQAPLNWTGVKNTTKDGNTCFSVKQNNDKENEDCLFINVYTPVLNDTSNESLPVMLWIYGGAFRTGSASHNSFGPEFLIEKGVVVATFNYRVGPFGFLATEDGVISGNAGLKDQAFAIQWVHDHISLFGGDAKQVTIFGQSAGGASVGYQLLYKKNEGLFRAAILQSGSPLSSFSFMGDVSARAYAFDLASQIDGTIDFKNSTTLLADFLINNVTGRQIDTASTLTTVTSRPLPVIEDDIDGAFLTRESYELLAAGDFIKVPIMIGTTSEEAIYAVTSLSDSEETFDKYEAKHAKFVPSKGFNLKSGINSTEVGEEIYQLYFENVTDADRLGYFIRYISDNEYSKPMIKHAELSSTLTDVYFYIFSYDGIMGNWNTTVKSAGKVGHGEDDRYIWSISSSSYINTNLSVFPEQDQLVHKRVIELWTNFAKYSNPTPDSSSELLQYITWPKMNNSSFQYLDIDSNLTVREGPKSPYYAGWSSLYEKFNQRPFTIF